MLTQNEIEEILGEIEEYFLHHRHELTTISFPEGDAYLCYFDSNDWCDNGEELDSPNYEEWFALDFLVKEVLVPGPNKDPRFEYIEVSAKRMPVKFSCNNNVLYEDGKLLI